MLLFAPVGIRGRIFVGNHAPFEVVSRISGGKNKMNKFTEHMTKLWSGIQDNVVFILQFIGIVAGIILAAYLVELLIRKKNPVKEKVLTTRKIAVIGVMSAISAVLMLFEIPLPGVSFFYKLDFSDLPALLCGLAYGPVAGVVTEAVKILLNLLMDGTATAFVGELANFIIGSVFVLTATIIYHIKKTKKMAIIACVAATLMITLFGTAFNGIYLLPKFASFMLPMDAIIASGTAENSNVNSLMTFLLFCTLPTNLIKGVLVSGITIVLYQPLRPILKKTV